ncbi:HNH endonuclease [Bacillus phage Moonbeam]|uniref:AP2/ERF domain-containing protein n=1 Tax=Bacillus phage Moonbeam TaxID=1540091 RepID=A0A0A0RSP2_9CAUD|nr:HNH endonuclease [Bacillus phage Moonbeam]AIW03551.1 hypothetical protein CPT_Moonbeam153 [Bacillus phage Moonbeam]
MSNDPRTVAQRTQRLGARKKNQLGSWMEVVLYNTAGDITVKFSNGYLVKTRWFYFEKGNVISPYDRTVHGVGFLGVGKHAAYRNRKPTPEYATWKHMLYRCYDERHAVKQPTYKGCWVAKEWHNFQNFAEWYNENWYTVGTQKMCLDKDIINKGNKTYSPDTCIFVPERINTLIINNGRSRGKYPIGVSYVRTGKTYVAKYRRDSHSCSLGVFKTIEEAFNAYKQHKEAYICEVAEQYRDCIPKKLYQALTCYKIEITD